MGVTVLKYSKVGLGLALGLALTACAPGPHLFVTTAIISSGTELGPEMRDRNMIATVGFDEDYIGSLRLPRPVRTIAYLQGVAEKTPEYQLRVAYLNLAQLKGFAWYADGQLAYATVGAIPEHIGRLKAWDLVEYRSSGTYRTMEHFASRQEGNIVVRVLCRKADPGYEKCRDALPQVRKYPNGSLGTPYPVSVSDYGYTFTPAYDEAGRPTRVIPEYVVKKP